MKLYDETCAIPLDLQFRHMPASGGIRRQVRQYLDQLAGFVVPPARCAVVIGESRSGRQGGIYDISVRLSIPGRRLYTAHVSDKGSAGELLGGALGQAFEDIRHQMIKARARRRRRRAARAEDRAFFQRGEKESV